MDDMVLTASSTTLLRDFINKLKSAFAIKDMGPLAYFLGVDMQHTSDGFFLSQAKYVDDVLERASMLNCKVVSTPAEAKPKQSLSYMASRLARPTRHSFAASLVTYST
jgi:hypothetical protein